MFSVSIDLDPLSCYHQIYGLGPIELESDPCTTLAIERFITLMEPFGEATLFVVGNTLNHASTASAIKKAVEAGHEVGNHTWSHPYDLSLMHPEQIDSQIDRANAAIGKVAGQVVHGFRAPGYLLGPQVRQRVVAAQMLYDSSSLPSPFYYATKYLARSLLSLAGKNSHTIVGNWAEATGTKRPHKKEGLVELPISTMWGWPLLGGSLALLGRRLVTKLAKIMAKRSYLQLELHGIDLVDLQTPGVDPHLSVQVDLRIPWEKKLSIFQCFISEVIQQQRLTTLEHVARSQQSQQ